MNGILRPYRGLVLLVLLLASGAACSLPGRTAATSEIILEPTVRPSQSAPGLDLPPTAAAALSTPEPEAASPVATSVFRDDFDGALGAGWSRYLSDAPGSSLSAMPGWLRLSLSSGSFLGGSPPNNLLLRPAPSGDSGLTTSLRFSPIRNFELAGLVIIFDDQSALQLGRGFCEVTPPAEGCIGDGLYFDYVQGGASVGGNLATQSFLGLDYLLRLERQGTSYTASFSIDGVSWTPLGSHTVDRQPTFVGLIAAQAETPGNFADFDYFEMSQH